MGEFCLTKINLGTMKRSLFNSISYIGGKWVVSLETVAKTINCLSFTKFYSPLYQMI